ncbi:MAG: DUF4091 domain-containing protein [Oscillospiraceae bacterium]
MNPKIKFKVISSLEKVFPDQEPTASKLVGNESIFRGESYSFQIAFKIDETGGHKRVDFIPKIVCEVAKNVTVKNVSLVPCEMTCFEDRDDDYIREAQPGLYPDVISDIGCEYGLATALNTMWRSVWVEFKPDENTSSGTHSIMVEFVDEEGISYGIVGTQVRLIEAELEKQELLFTQWFHGDCISSYYGVKTLSDRHFELMEKFIKTAVNNGINMLLTPLFTPPLDTKIGGERPTIQLVDVTVNNGKYTFGFDNLHRFINICKGAGIEYYEMSHLFTQWGAKHAPKIMATVDGEYKRIFGWETSATSDEYKAFLSEFLPKLVAFLHEEKIAETTYFHVSDEPEMGAIENYRLASLFVAEYLKGFKMMDALSDYAFYEKGLVGNPIPSTDHIKPFLDNNVPNLWTYYCCAQDYKVSNRFIAMSSARNRVIAAQLFKYDIKGFLHWGYNFWYSQYSTRLINPFAVTDSGCAFPAGDAFSVYPGTNGPLESIRIKVFASALYDLRAMKMLEKLVGKEEVLKIIEKDIQPIEFDNAPNSEDYILGTRLKINQAIEKALNLN